MADTTTTNYGLTKPAVNDPTGDSAWGAKLNTNFDTIDTNLKRVDSAASSGGGGGAPTAVITGATGTTVTAAAADKGKVYLLNGSGTLSLPAAVQVAGWSAWVKKSDGNGVWAITPASVTIEGLASINCYQESYLIWWDAANSVFRTQDRPKGWINLGSVTVASAVASVTFTTGFGDAELRDQQFTGENIGFSASDTIAIRVQKGGSYQTSGYVNQYFGYAGQTVSSGSGNTSSFGPQNQSSTTNMGFDFTLFTFGNASFQRFGGTVFTASPVSFGISQGAQTGTAGAIAGMMLATFGGSNITAGAISQRGFRP